jgi:beta-lactamase superfamily II metal-dependent hydrolase
MDGGKIGAYPSLREKVRSLRWEDSLIHLLVVTHVDADHIEGIIGLLTDEALGATFGEIWFNGWPQIQTHASETLGTLQGELLGCLIGEKWPDKWNYSWADRPRRTIYRETSEPLPLRTCEGMSFTLLSPDLPRIERLRAAWENALRREKLNPQALENTLAALQRRHRNLLKGPTLGTGDADEWQALLRTPFASDDATNNGSSLAFLAEFSGASCLLLGDAFPGVVFDALSKVASARNVTKIPIDLMKVSHHGSEDNTHNALLDVIECKHFLFSTDGSLYGHPDEECVARIVARCGPDVHLYFNTDHSERKVSWNNVRMQERHRFQVHYPGNDSLGISVDVASGRSAGTWGLECQ